MFGQNTPRRREHGDNLQVHNVFYTIQGEGPFAGDPATFIRLTGCNLRCWFCDTTWGDETDDYRDVESWVNMAVTETLSGPTGNMRTNLAVITGGEPARQDLEKLVKLLYSAGFKRIQIETTGTYWQECFDFHFVTLVVSPKTSKVNKEFRSRAVNWKYVLKDGEIDESDGLPSASTQRIPGRDAFAGGAPARPNDGDMVYLQPCDEHDGPHSANKNLAAVRDSALKFGYRAGLQLHKFFEVE